MAHSCKLLFLCEYYFFFFSDDDASMSEVAWPRAIQSDVNGDRLQLYGSAGDDPGFCSRFKDSRFVGAYITT